MRTLNTPASPAPESGEQARSPRTFGARLGTGLAMAASLAFAGVGLAAPVQADESLWRGPDPTDSSVEDADGPFSVEEDSVSSLGASGFGGGTVYYPEETDEGTFGAVAIAPGYTAGQSSMAWLGERLASHGFVAFTIDTNTRYDQPTSRGRQLEAALDYLVEDSDSEVQDRIDPDRLAVMGHSMGGGGTLSAAESRPELRAAIPLTGWHTQKNWGDVDVPTLVIGAENDTIASVRSHSIPFYESLPETNKAYLELDGAGHFAPNLSNTPIAKHSISWLKLFVDEDTRYEQFLCPGPDSGGFGDDASDYRETIC